MAEKHKERVQFDFFPEALQRLDNIKEKTEAATRAEVIRNALKVYEWLVNELDSDSTIKVLDRSNKEIAIIKTSLLLK
jgi:metal-responsive CopG/Arc/MetJ family transcriptional regulator